MSRPLFVDATARPVTSPRVGRAVAATSRTRGGWPADASRGRATGRRAARAGWSRRAGGVRSDGIVARRARRRLDGRATTGHGSSAGLRRAPDMDPARHPTTVPGRSVARTAPAGRHPAQARLADRVGRSRRRLRLARTALPARRGGRAGVPGSVLIRGEVRGCRTRQTAPSPRTARGRPARSDRRPPRRPTSARSASRRAARGHPPEGRPPAIAAPRPVRAATALALGCRPARRPVARRRRLPHLRLRSLVGRRSVRGRPVIRLPAVVGGQVARIGIGRGLDVVGAVVPCVVPGPWLRRAGGTRRRGSCSRSPPPARARRAAPRATPTARH